MWRSWGKFQGKNKRWRIPRVDIGGLEKGGKQYLSKKGAKEKNRVIFT